MASNLDDALFWVQEGFGENNNKYFVKGSDFAANAKGAEIVWVQRDDEKFWTYHSAPPDGATPDLTYRFIYTIDPVDTWQNTPGDQRSQPAGDGVLNFSYYYGNPGPYGENQWKNIRNTDNSINDLDGKPFKCINNPDIEYGDIVRIRHEGGDFEAWYVIDNPDDHGGHVQFQVFNHSNVGSERLTYIKASGTRPSPQKPGEGHVPVLEFAVYKAVEPYNKIRDTDWVWAQKQDPDTGEYVKYKVSGKNFRELFNVKTANFSVTEGTVKFNMKMYDTSKTYQIERVEDGQLWNVSGTYTNTTMNVGNYIIPMDDCEWFKTEYSTGTYEFKPNFNTSNVRCMYRAVFNCSNFNSAVNHFDMSNVTNTADMFYNSRKFNQSISGWDLSSCTNASRMFMHATEFNGEVDDLVFGTTYCASMFFNANKFNQSLTNWDTANITNANNMFNNCRSFNKPINHLNFTGTNNVSYAFRNCIVFNQDLTGIEWKDRTNFAYAFFNCKALNHPGLRTWPFPSHAYNISYAFGNCSGFRQSIAGWTEPIPGYASGLFYGWTQFNQRVSHLNFSNATIYDNFFSGCSIFNPDDIGDLDLGTLTRAANFLNGCVKLNRDLGKWDVSKLWDMAGFFMNTNCRHFNISGWNMSNVSYFNNMFRSSIVGDDLSGWDTSKGSKFQNMFRGWGTKTGSLSTTDKLDIKIDNWDMRSAANIQNMFLTAGDKNYIANINTNAWRMPSLKYNQDLSNLSQQAWMDWNTNVNFIEGIPGIGMPVIEPGYEPTYTIFGGPLNSKIYFSRVSNWVISDGKGIRDVSSSDQQGMGLNITNAQLDIFEVGPGNIKFNPYTDFRLGVNQHNWEFMEAYGPHPELMNAPTNMYALFAVDSRASGYGDWKLSNVTGFEHINTQNVTNMVSMFTCQSGITGQLEISGWDVEQVNNMDWMFDEANNKFRAGDLSGWCVRNVTSEPERWPSPISTIVEKDPYWGLCPSDPDFVPPLIDKPLPPDGAWERKDQGYWFSLDDDAPSSKYHIGLGSYMAQQWKAYKGSQNWSRMSDSNGMDVEKGYQYIVTAAASKTPTFTTDAPLKFHGINISNVRNMSNLFKVARNFNDDISWWITSNVTNMTNMFNGATKFNQNLSGWDVSNVRARYGYDYNTHDWDPSYKPKFN